jgi:hypothetical protein
MPVFCHTAFTVPFRSAVFPFSNSFFFVYLSFLQVVRRGSGALPYRQPLLDIHTHPWPGGVSFLRKNPPPSVGFEPTSAKGVAMIFCWGGPDFKPQTDDR